MSDYDDFCDDCYEEGYEDGYNEGRRSHGPRGTRAVIERNNRRNQENGCYVATAVYGSYDCPEVWVLRRYRDFTLARSWYGRAFIRAYYAISPKLVKCFGHTKVFKRLCRKPLDKKIAALRANGVDDSAYQDIDWR